MADSTPEDVYRAAAEAALRRHVGDDQVDGLSAEYLDELITDWWDTPDSRARADAAYAAGRGAAARDIVDRANADPGDPTTAYYAALEIMEGRA